MSGISFVNVASASDLSADIKAIDLASQASGGNGTHYSITLTAGATLTEAAQLSAINLAPTDTPTIDGAAPGESHGADVNSDGGGMVTDHRLYQLVRQSGPVIDRTFTIQFLDPDVQAYAFTFG